MSEISPISPTRGAAVTPGASPAPSARDRIDTVFRAADGDRVDLSDLARLRGRLETLGVRDIDDQRLERVAELRAEIAGGRFETSERVDRTIERLLGALGD